jgi:crotonobetainyl-CoA:carnitine CoA-transferase CaiB-like acyl-CoA transferase
MPGPLEGLRVLELARILAGPWAGQTLADLGADVIKVERAGTGDDTRTWGPPFVAAADGGHLGAAYYHSTNRGKRSIAIDFDSAEGCDVVRRLASRSDVVIENFKAGSLARFGLDYKSLSAAYPGLVYCSVTGFGQDGPYAHRAGYDFVVQGMGGFMDITGAVDGEPMKAGVAYADVFTGVYAAVAILAALRERDRTGTGAHIDMALLDTQVGVLGNQALNYFVSGVTPRRMGNAHNAIVPYQMFAVADGHIVIACGNDGQFRKLCAVLGESALAHDPAYRLNRDRVVNRDALVTRLAAIIARFQREVLLSALEAAGVPAGPINTVAQVFTDPQVTARGMKITMVNPDAADRAVAGVRTPITIGGWRACADRAPPSLGQHTEEILRELEEPPP